MLLLLLALGFPALRPPRDPRSSSSARSTEKQPCGCCIWRASRAGLPASCAVHRQHPRGRCRWCTCCVICCWASLQHATSSRPPGNAARAAHLPVLPGWCGASQRAHWWVPAPPAVPRSPLIVEATSTAWAVCGFTGLLAIWPAPPAPPPAPPPLRSYATPGACGRDRRHGLDFVFAGVAHREAGRQAASHRFVAAPPTCPPDLRPGSTRTCPG